MATHLIDSNVIIEFLGGFLPDSGSAWLQRLTEQNNHSISVINRIELLSYNGAQTEMDVLIEFIESTDEFLLTETAVLKTIELRQQTKIKLPDAIIAATALVHQLVLVTRNTDDFKNIPGLTVINPHSV